jgi:hypothetical protein
VFADEARGGLELLEGAGLHELARAVHGAAHRTSLRVLAIGEREVLEAEGRAERADEEDAVGLVVLDAPVVAADVGALQSAVADDEGDAVDEGEVLAHREQRVVRGGDAHGRILRERAERVELAGERLVVDTALLADGAGGEPPAGLGLGIHLDGRLAAEAQVELAAHLLDRRLGVGGVERGGERLLLGRDHVERAGDAGVEAGGRVQHGGHTRDERALAVDVCGPAAECRDARNALTDLLAQEVEIGDRELSHAIDHEKERFGCKTFHLDTSSLESPSRKVRTMRITG